MHNLLIWAALANAAVVSIGFAVIGYWSTVHAVRQIFRWPKAPAEILRYWIVRSEDEPHGQRFFRPVLRFTTIDGGEFITISNSWHWRRPWPLGHVVLVRYRPDNPALGGNGQLYESLGDAALLLRSGHRLGRRGVPCKSLIAASISYLAPHAIASRRDSTPKRGLATACSAV